MGTSGGESRGGAWACRLARWAHPHLISKPSLSPSSSSFPPPGLLPLSALPSLFFYFSNVFFFQDSSFPPLPLSPLVLHPLPFRPLSPESTGPRRGPDPTPEPSEAESPPSAER